jgi:hypothetical protein
MFSINRFNKFFFVSFIILLSFNSFPADIIDSIEEEDRLDTPANASTSPQLFNESIKSISPSKKIFIISNNNQSYSRGDYVSVLVANQLVCRALVAKTTDSQLGGIKIIKIYNNTLWNQLAKNKEILILKGDDSYYTNNQKVAGTADEKSKKGKKGELDKIESEEDLFTTTTNDNEDDLSVEENNKRLIKPDNLLGINYGLLQALDNDGKSTRYPHINGNWGYQLTDNVWGEIGVGTNTITDYPDVSGLGGLDTRLLSFNFRLKYTINAPFYSYIMPYAGYQIVTANSPGAGVDSDGTTSPTTLQKEIERVDALKKSGPIFGVTVLRRIVPGWFARADLGSDLIGGGLTLEF